MGRSFGYNRNENADDYRGTGELLTLLIDCVSRGGNLLLDIGPTADGRIPVIMQQRLLEMGKWLDVNGEAIFGTQAWRAQQDGEIVRYTAKDGAVYAICLKWPGTTLTLNEAKPGANVAVSMLGVNDPVACSVDGGKLVIQVPQLTPDKVPCQYAYVFKLTCLLYTSDAADE